MVYQVTNILLTKILDLKLQCQDQIYMIIAMIESLWNYYRDEVNDHKNENDNANNGINK